MECVIIGRVNSPIKEPVDLNWGEIFSEIVLEPEYVPGLVGLLDFSHLLVLTILHKADYIPEEHLIRRPQEREDMPLIGIFAQRARHRPNRIGITAVELVEVKENCIKVRGLDVIDGTPVIDIKPYVPLYDKKEATVPNWMDLIMKDYF